MAGSMHAESLHLVLTQCRIRYRPVRIAPQVGAIGTMDPIFDPAPFHDRLDIAEPIDPERREAPLTQMLTAGMKVVAHRVLPFGVRPLVTK